MNDHLFLGMPDVILDTHVSGRTVSPMLRFHKIIIIRKVEQPLVNTPHEASHPVSTAPGQSQNKKFFRHLGI